MNMEVSMGEQSPPQIMGKVESELEEMRESVRQGTTQADSDQVVTAAEVFGELRRRNAAAAKQTAGLAFTKSARRL